MARRTQITIGIGIFVASLAASGAYGQVPEGQQFERQSGVTHRADRTIIPSDATRAARHVMTSRPGALSAREQAAAENLMSAVLDTRRRLALVSLADGRGELNKAGARALHEHAGQLRALATEVVGAQSERGAARAAVGRVQASVDELAQELEAIAALPVGQRASRADRLLERLRQDTDSDDVTPPPPTIRRVRTARVAP